MPAARARKARTPDQVPGLGDPERKRVLNVLAQRRYRQKRRQKIAELEAKLKSSSTSTESSHPSLQDGGVQLDFDVEIETTSAPDSSLESPDSAGDNNLQEVARSQSPNVLPFDYSAFDFGNVFVNMDLDLLPDTPFPPTTTTTTATTPQLPQRPSPMCPFPLTPDHTHLHLPFLPVLTAFLRIATILNLTENLYNPTYLHILPPGPTPPSLPPNLAPTPAQTSIPHHPALDTLPWPGAREKLIITFALPSALRPPAARDDEDGKGAGNEGSAIMRLMLDIDDWREGVRNHGNMCALGDGNELVEQAWEVGGAFFRNWWWCLDAHVVALSNLRRRERGLGRLSLVE